MRRNKSKYYINKEDFYDRVCDHVEKIKLAKEFNLDIPIMSRKLELDFWNLCKNISNHTWFRRYTYLDDMISEGLLECVRRVHNFDHNKSDNAFGFFTQVVWRSFRRFSILEYSQTKTKLKLADSVEANFKIYDTQPGDDYCYSGDIGKAFSADEWASSYVIGDTD
jgi:hypothetical protein